MARRQGTAKKPAAKVNKRSMKKDSGPGSAAKTAAESGGELADARPNEPSRQVSPEPEEVLSSPEQAARRAQQETLAKQRLQAQDALADLSRTQQYAWAMVCRFPWKRAALADLELEARDYHNRLSAALKRMLFGNFTVAELDELCPFSIVDVRQCCSKLRRKCLEA